MGLTLLIVCPDIYMEFDSLDYTVKQAYLSWVEAARIRQKYGCEPPLGVVKTTKPVIIYVGERKEIHGITKIKHGGYSVNCISEPAMEKALPKGFWYCSFECTTPRAPHYQGLAVFHHHQPPKMLLCQSQCSLLTLVACIMMNAAQGCCALAGGN